MRMFVIVAATPVMLMVMPMIVIVAMVVSVMMVVMAVIAMRPVDMAFMPARAHRHGRRAFQGVSDAFHDIGHFVCLLSMAFEANIGYPRLFSRAFSLAY